MTAWIPLIDLIKDARGIDFYRSRPSLDTIALLARRAADE